MSKLLLVLLLVTLFTFSYQGSCRKGGDTLEFEDAETSVLDAATLRKRFFRKSNKGRQQAAQAPRQQVRQAREQFARPTNNIRGAAPKGRRPIFEGKIGKGRIIRGIGRLIGRGIETTRNGMGNIAKYYGNKNYEQKVINSKKGNIQVTSQLQSYAKDLCLDTQFFCYIDCPNTFNMKCKVQDAEIYSIRIPKEEHQNRCVAPRLAQGHPNNDDCQLTPCHCKTYESWFYGAVGKGEYNDVLNKIQGQCSSWCETGVKPAGVWDKKTFTKKVSKLKKLGKFLAAPFKAIGKAVKKIGRAIGKVFRRFRRL